jgi:ATP-dependent Clp protease ATP-binding subunit ClpX
MGDKSQISCSFCRRNYRHAGPLIEGPNDIYICGDCVELCQSLLDQERRRRGRLEARGPSVPPPGEFQAKLDPVIRHEAAKDALIQAARHHYEREDGGPPSLVLLVGPSRSSRLLLARALAHAIGVPFAATRFGAEGGQPVLLELLGACDYEVDLARFGIISVDGLDQRVAQEALLRPADWMQDASLRRMQFDFSQILFIGGGEFAGLDETVAGMGRHPEQPVTGEALLALGVLSELVARLSAIVRVPALDEETLSRIVSWVDFQQMTPDDQRKHLTDRMAR